MCLGHLCVHMQFSKPFGKTNRYRFPIAFGTGVFTKVSVRMTFRQKAFWQNISIHLSKWLSGPKSLRKFPFEWPFVRNPFGKKNRYRCPIAFGTEVFTKGSVWMTFRQKAFCQNKMIQMPNCFRDRSLYESLRSNDLSSESLLAKRIAKRSDTIRHYCVPQTVLCAYGRMLCAYCICVCILQFCGIWHLLCD